VKNRAYQMNFGGKSTWANLFNWKIPGYGNCDDDFSGPDLNFGKIPTPCKR
jgi:hypothetical protein